MRACLIDPLGPLWRRVVPWGPISTRDVDVLLGAGRVAFRDQLVLRTLRTRDVVGASTAPTLRGVAVSLALRGRGGRPLTLEVADAAEASELRRALGIGDDPFGALGLPTNRSVASDGERIVRSVAVVFSGFGVVGFAEGAPIFLWSLTPLFILACVAVARAFRPPGLLLTPRSLRLRSERGWDELELAAIRFVLATGEGLKFDMASGDERTIGVETDGGERDRATRAELHVIAAQIEAAAQRAR